MVRLQVRELAEDQDLNMSQLLRRAHRLSPGAKLSYPTVHALWHNKTRRPDLDTLAVIARALGVHPGTLIVANDDEEEERDAERAYDAAKAALAAGDEELIPWEQVKAELAQQRVAQPSI